MAAQGRDLNVVVVEFLFPSARCAGSPQQFVYGQCLFLGYPPVPISGRLNSHLLVLLYQLIQRQIRNAGSKTLIRILRRLWGLEFCELESCSRLTAAQMQTCRVGRRPHPQLRPRWLPESFFEWEERIGKVRH